MCLLMGEGTACGGLPFSGTGCPIWCWQSLLVMYLTFMFGILFLFFYFSPPPYDVFVHGSCFSNNGLNMLPWTSFTCYTKDNQQGCFRLSNWFSLRRLGPWMNHLLLHDSSLFWLTFQNESWYVCLEWYFIYLLLFLASVHGFMHETSGDFFTLY